MSETYSVPASAGDELGRGRIVDPNEIDATGSEPAEPTARTRKRRSDAGQPRGPRTASGTGKNKAAVTPLDLSSLTGMFVGLHAVLAVKTGVQELAITPEEGQQFMDSAANVMRHYSVQTTQKTMDWIAFMGCACGLYIPRAIAIFNNTQKADKPEPQAEIIEVPQFIRPNGHGG